MCVLSTFHAREGELSTEAESSNISSAANLAPSSKVTEVPRQERKKWACLQGDNGLPQTAPHGEASIKNEGEDNEPALRNGREQTQPYPHVQTRHTTTCHWPRGCYDCQRANMATHTPRSSDKIAWFVECTDRRVHIYGHGDDGGLLLS